MLNIGIGAMSKFLEVDMNEAALQTDTTRSILGNILQVVIVLFWQRDNQLKSGLPRMEVHIDHS